MKSDNLSVVPFWIRSFTNHNFSSVTKLMNCTVCQRDLAPDWSVCPKCGAMKNDSVREELLSSLTPRATPLKFQPAEPSAAAPESKPEGAVVEKAPVKRRVQTADISIKKTSQTLAEFKNRNATVPDWRLQLQNTVRQRTGRAVPAESTTAVASTSTQINGANALKVRYSEETAIDNEAELKVANALKRIEQSRRTYLPSEKAREGIRVAKAAAQKFPFNVVSRSADAPETQPAAADAPAVRPRLISSMKIEKKAYDTNKLPPLPTVDAEYGNEDEILEPRELELKENWSQKIEIIGSNTAEADDVSELEMSNDIEPETEEIDDLAPLLMRFNAGLFDVIIGAFATSIILSPFLASAEGWLSFSGFLVFTGVLLSVMFLYLTSTLTFLGQTFGMKLFSLELVDVEQSELPSLHQAAVSSAVYLLSLVLGGLGFVPVFLNEERRAAHDIVSGTILVRSA